MVREWITEGLLCQNYLIEIVISLKNLSFCKTYKVSIKIFKILHNNCFASFYTNYLCAIAYRSNNLDLLGKTALHSRPSPKDW